jgi:hypothetical protein
MGPMRVKSVTVYVLGAALSAVVMIVVILAGLFEDDRPAPAAAPREQLTFDGYAPELPIEDLIRVSTIVVVGTPVAVSEHSYADNPAIDHEVRQEGGAVYQYGRYRDHTFEVDEYIRGQAAAEISIRTPAPPGSDQPVAVESEESFDLQPDARYVLFLDEGRDITKGGWLLVGQQGIGRVAADGNSVTLGYGQTTTIEDLRKLAASESE